MTVITMSRNELTRLRVLIDIADGRLSVADATGLIGVGRRQIYRLLDAFRARGPDGLISRKQIAGPVASFTGDGAYDRDDVYREVCQRHPDAAVIVPPRSGAVPSATAETTPTKRDRHLQLIAERGRMGWQRVSGYNWRALVEADIGRYKRVIGDALRSRTKGRQTTEVAIAVASLNRMLELGRPESDANRDAAVETVLEADAVATTVRSLMSKRTSWEGTATDLLSALN